MNIKGILTVATCLVAFLFTAGDAIGQGQREPKRYALLIAVNSYEHSAIDRPKLKYPQKDAKAVGEFLSKHGYEVRYLLGQNATKNNIVNSLEGLATKGNSPGCLIVGLWGHGVEFKGSAEAMFCPYDAGIRFAVDSKGRKIPDDKGNNLLEPNPETLVGMSKILDGMTLSKAGNHLLLADCCRASPNPARGRAFGSNVTFADLPDNTAAIFACQANERAFENDLWKHGAMTLVLLDLFSKKVKLAESDVASLFTPLRKQVRQLVSKATNGRERQTIHPILKGFPELSFTNISIGSPKLQLANMAKKGLEERWYGFANDSRPFEGTGVKQELMIEIGKEGINLLILNDGDHETKIEEILDKIDLHLRTIYDQKKFDSALKVYQTSIEFLFAAPTPDPIPPHTNERISKFLSRQGNYDSSSLFKSTPVNQLNMLTVARWELIRAVAPMIASDKELRRAFDDLVFPRIDQAKFDTQNLDLIVKNMNARFRTEFFNNSDPFYVSELKAKMEALCELNAETHTFFLNSLNQLEKSQEFRARGTRSAKLLSTLPIASGDFEDWRTISNAPTLLMVTHCDCGNEVAAIKCLRELDARRELPNLNIVLCALTDKAQVKMREQGSMFPILRIDVADPESVPWLDNAPAFVLLDDHGRITASCEGINVENSYLLRNRIQLLANSESD